jgi:hypothetical protein
LHFIKNDCFNLCLTRKEGLQVQFSNVQMTLMADLLIYASRAQIPGLRQAHGDLSVTAAGQFKEWNS